MLGASFSPNEFCRLVSLTSVFLFAGAVAQSESGNEDVQFDHVVAHWRLGDADATARDVAGIHGEYRHGAAGTAAGALRGSCDHSAQFDGKDDLVVIPHDNRFHLDAGTVCFFFLADDLERNQGLLSRDANGHGEGGHLTISLDDRRVYVRLQDRKKSHEVRSEKLHSGWNHVAFSWGKNGMQLYVDGHRDDKDKHKGGIGDNREPFVIGASSKYRKSKRVKKLSDYFRGRIDEVVLFQRQLSEKDIQKLARADGAMYDQAAGTHNALAAAYSALEPIAWWPLSNSSGEKVAIDRAGNNDGQITGDIPPFNGRDEHVHVGTLDTDAKQLTILAWFQAEHFKNFDSRIISKATGTDLNTHYWMLSTTKHDGKDRLRFRLRAKQTTKELIADAGDLQPGQEVFAAAVYDGKHMRLYKDGKLVGKVPHKGRVATNSHAHAWIGDNPSGQGSRPFAGIIHDVALFDKALSASDIQSIQIAGTQPKTTSDKNQIAADAAKMKSKLAAQAEKIAAQHAELATQQAEIAAQRVKQQAELAKAAKARAQASLEQARMQASLAAQKQAMEKQQQALNRATKELAKNRARLEAAKKEIDTAKKRLKAKRKKLKAAEAELKKAQTPTPTIKPAYQYVPPKARMLDRVLLKKGDGARLPASKSWEVGGGQTRSFQGFPIPRMPGAVMRLRGNSCRCECCR